MIDLTQLELDERKPRFVSAVEEQEVLDRVLARRRRISQNNMENV